MSLYPQERPGLIGFGPCPVCGKERILLQERVAGGPLEIWRDPVRYYYVATCQECGHSVTADRTQDLETLWNAPSRRRDGKG